MGPTLLLIFVAALTAVTVLPLSGRHQWWIRMWDFPRVQIAALQGVAVLLALWVGGWAGLVAGLAAAAGLALHLVRIRPFTPLARIEMGFAGPRDDGHEVTVMASNVLLENEDASRLLRLIDEADPDVLLLMETDETWVERLRPVIDRYPTVLISTDVKYYGMVFATRLETRGAALVELTDDETPTCFADLRTPGGRLFHFVGLHPQPPVPGVDTEERDAQILYAARFARKTDVPVIAMGDFNDAAWSDTSAAFKRYGRYLDPRVGRGLYASFHAKNVLIRVAIDQLFVSEEVVIRDFRLGPAIGSDHFPVIARVRIDPEEGRRLNKAPPPLSDEERETLAERLEAYAKELKRRPAIDDATGAAPVAARPGETAEAKAEGAAADPAATAEPPQ